MTNNAPVKIGTATVGYAAGGGSSDTSGTATAGFVNCLKINITLTASYAFASLYGWRTS
jgi:hypothetical protein